MASPAIEFRNYWRKATIEDIRKGLQPVRLPVGPPVEGFQPSDMFIAEGLQFRYKEKVYVNGGQVTQWTDWQTVPLVREGDEISTAPPAPDELDPPAASKGH